MDMVSHDTEGFDSEGILLSASDNDIQQEYGDGIIIKDDFIPVDLTDYMIRGPGLEVS